MYAILDIETTGGKYNEEGITEIAIYRFDGHQVVDQFISLINPERDIEPYVVKLTGISNKMLRNAPKFYELAKRIIEITKDAIIVAHNTNFDYRILKTEFKRLGYDYQRNTLCTVDLSKKLIPNEESYSLGKLCKSLMIPISNRHRASGDAYATVQLFKLLMEKDLNKTIFEQSIKYLDGRHEKKKKLSILESLPQTQGILYIHNIEGNIIYITKGKNLRAEMNKLFLKQSNRAKNINKRIHSVTYQETGNTLFTRLKYYLELDTIKPKYNIIRSIKGGKNFTEDNFIIIDKGRIPEEHAVILVENNVVYGYGYTNLAYQETHIDVLKKVLTPIENKPLAKKIISGWNGRMKLRTI